MIKRMLTTLTVFCILILSTSAQGQIIFETGIAPTPIYHFEGSGADFVASGYTTRTAISGTTQTFMLPPIPATASPVVAFLVWNYLADASPPPTTDTVALNLCLLSGNRLGYGNPDLCWGMRGGVSYITKVPLACVNIGGFNTVSGASDKMLGGARALGEGVSLIVVYEITREEVPWRSVDVWGGYTSTRTQTATNWTSSYLQFTYPYIGGKAHFLFNALDGQTYGDEFYINGINAGGIVNGTNTPTDAWAGFLGPMLVNNLYDHVEDGVQGFMAVGDLGIKVSTWGYSDCLGHSVAVMSLEM